MNTFLYTLRAVLTRHVWRLLTYPLAYVDLSRFPNEMGSKDNAYSDLTRSVLKSKLV